MSLWRIPELDALSTEDSAKKFAALESRLTQALDAARETKESTFGSFDLLVARIGQRTNDIMKVLTLVTVILLPSTVLAGIMGMNFKVGLFDAGVGVLDRDRRDARHRRARTLSRAQSTLDLRGQRYGHLILPTRGVAALRSQCEGMPSTPGCRLGDDR